jgi:hypothetical protein
MKARKGLENNNRPAPPDQHNSSRFTTRELPSLAEDSALDAADKADNTNRADYTTKKLPVISLDQESIDLEVVAEQTVVPSDAQAVGDAEGPDQNLTVAPDVDSDSIARLTRRAEAAELDREALEERIRVLQRRGRGSSEATVPVAGSSGRLEALYWLRELAIALVLGLALLALLDYWVAGDAIPFLPEPTTEPTMVAPATAAPTSASSSPVTRAAPTRDPNDVLLIVWRRSLTDESVLPASVPR